MLTACQQRLIALNLVLALGVMLVALLPAAGGERGGSIFDPRSALAGQPVSRQRGQYVMIAGRAQGSTTNVVYILDTVNQELVAVRYNRGTQALEPIGFRNVGEDGKIGGGGR
ncbi:MAG: hypothetical protein ACT4PL_09555 [Phycisphaerales bacterium]